MRITVFFAILLHFGHSQAEPCRIQGFGTQSASANVSYLICQGISDTDFPINASYFGKYDSVLIVGSTNLTKIPAGALFGISTSQLEIDGNENLVTIESGFMQGSEIDVLEIHIYGNEALR